MNVEKFLKKLDVDFFVGVPDSQLKELCNHLMYNYGLDRAHHIIAANEGNCVAIAAGYYLSTGKIPVVYMQNSGEGNIINPVASLTSSKVYSIPIIFIVGWRGKPGVHDEPQHVFQGEITLKLLEDIGIKYCVLNNELNEESIDKNICELKKQLELGNSIAFVVEKNFFDSNIIFEYKNSYDLLREDIIEHIVKVSGNDPIISTTGKTSRELFEIREKLKQTHNKDFLTVGSMGHASSISLGIALNSKKRIWCIDGDGAAIMHLGAMTTIGYYNPKNLIHIIINNESHESVGGQPTVASKIDFVNIAKSCGYQYAVCVDNLDEFDIILNEILSKNILCFIEVKSKIGSRTNLGRPTLKPAENKERFMRFINFE